MLRPVIEISIQQQQVDGLGMRNKTFNFDFVTACEVVSTWQQLTDTARLVFPKRLFFKEGNNKVSWVGKDLMIGNTPLLLRGDKISIKAGYRYLKNGQEVKELNLLFEGFISKVINRMPIEIECENEMYLLKQKQAPNKQFLASKYTLQTLVEELVQGSGLKVKTIGESFVDDFLSMDYTMAQAIDKLQKDYPYTFYIRNGELRCGILSYFEEERINHNIVFQQQVIEDRLEYLRKEEVKIIIDVYSFNSGNSSPKKHKKIKVTVGDSDGEKRTLFFKDRTEAELNKIAKPYLDSLKWEGFRGDFTTFGLPYIKHGDSVELVDYALPDRNGKYMVKAVHYKIDTNGIRQNVTLDNRL